MLRIVSIPLLLCFLGLTSLLAQDAPQAKPSPSQIIAELNAEEYRQARSISNRKQFQEAQRIAKDCAAYSEPNLGRALLDPQNIIATAVVAGAKIGGGGVKSTKLLDLKVEGFLRGASDVTELRNVQQYTGFGQARIYCAGGFSSAFYSLDAKAGSRYVIGYSFFNDMPVVYGAIDLADPHDAREMIDVKRFLNIEARAGDSDPAPLVEALADKVPWVRDLAAQRLVQSKACNDSADCRQAFMKAMRKLFLSKKFGDRREALNWTKMLVQPMKTDPEDWGHDGLSLPNGLARVSTDSVRDLLSRASSDPGRWIAEEAYEQLQFFDLYHSAAHGECIVTYSSLHKSVRLLDRELIGLQIGTYDCIPR